MTTSSETEIRDLFMSWLEALKVSDANRIRQHYADDIVAFDAVKHLQFKGRDTYMRHWADCFVLCPHPKIYEPAEVTVAATGGLAFSHALLRCGYVDEAGMENTAWMRATTCYRKTAGSWAIVHEHFSAPFDIDTGMAIVDAQP